MSWLDERKDSLRVVSVRLHGAADALRARQRFESAMSAVDPTGLGVPPQALHIVRRLAPTAPLSFEAGRTKEFGEAVGVELRRCAQTARRPWLQADASAADAVCFADEAELVACLVRDWLSGWVAERWWWHSVLWNLSVEQWLRQHVLPRGELLVPVLSLLAGGADAVAWMRQLDDAEAEPAIRSIQTAYALLRIDPWIATPPPPHPIHGQSVVEPIENNRRILETRVALEHLLATVPEVRAPALRQPQRRLLALALILARAPASARSIEFAAAWELLDHTDPVLKTRATTATDPSPPSEVPLSSTAPPPTYAPMVESRASLRPVDERAETRAPTSAARARGPLAGSSPHSTPPSQAVVDSVTQATEAEPPSTIGESTQPAATDILPSILTQFGGLFYLLNAALVLDLYGDFTAPRAPNLALSPWNLLALIGRAWFGAAFETDPLWTVLASLAGRSADQPPDHEFAAPTMWVIDQTWLEPWGRIPRLQYRATRTRLQVLHPVGFVLFDVPRDRHNSPRAQARHLCRSYLNLRDAAIAPATDTARSVRARSRTARWLGWLLPYLQARVARSLGGEPNAVPSLLCRHDARIVWSLSSVDVHLSLTALPLAIRIAGLDRDPGWIPAAGRAIAFHFA